MDLRCASAGDQRHHSPGRRSADRGERHFGGCRRSGELPRPRDTHETGRCTVVWFAGNLGVRGRGVPNFCDVGGPPARVRAEQLRVVHRRRHNPTYERWPPVGLFAEASYHAGIVSLAPSATVLTVEEIRPGDVVWIPPGEKHWHGASPTTAMTHIAIQEKLDGKPVDWLEHVTAEQYEGRSDAS
jgi:hypothetical protein